jgi:hypothetical protein
MKNQVRPKVKRTLMKMAQEWCDSHDKSTEFMIQYMQDFAGVDHDTVMEFLQEKSIIIT